MPRQLPPFLLISSQLSHQLCDVLSSAILVALEKISSPETVSSAPTPRFHPPSLLHNSLNEVKDLYFQRQYKQWTSYCINLLDDSTLEEHPVHVTYLNFYAALCYKTQRTLSRPFAYRSTLTDTPFPLRIRRDPATISPIPTLPSLPSPTITRVHHNQLPRSHTPTPNLPTQLRRAHLRAYNNHLTEFSHQLHDHIVAFKLLLKTALTPNRVPPRRSSVHILTMPAIAEIPYEEEEGLAEGLRLPPIPLPKAGSRMSDVEKAERINRGRARGWEVKRWDGRRYEEVRERAVMDLET
ncbi:hypothetical protein M501DRAFT_987363 [Patellaria atrata CBS 101060]|uniref:Uncharacterized protein n=1 Tax=Patellaria atrata CBS 101060 TaxID=1346257 RepID=A0A9P4S6N8_9PEZI|nr:hypothetical protein M501DRAFT_987363 [Patellaria atrata CBS 101060]